jgi:hypothetical protein
MFAKYQYDPIESIPITDEMFSDLQGFQALVQACRINATTMAVVTFGRKEVVQKALDYALGTRHGILIKTPGDYGVRDGSGELGDKNTQLADLAASFGFASSQIILVDDDRRNIDAAVNAGTMGQWTPDGLTRSMCTSVARQLDPALLSAMTLSLPAESTWGPQYSKEMGTKGSERQFDGKVPLLDPTLYTGVSSTCEALNSSLASNPLAGYCAVFSSTHQKYYLLYRSDKEGDALAALGIERVEQASCQACGGVLVKENLFCEYCGESRLASMGGA